MKIIEEKEWKRCSLKWTSCTRFFRFDNGAEVCIWFLDGMWEYQSDLNDDDTYISGNYYCDGDTVIDYDGVFELPQEVKIALSKRYKLDL